jgi:vacuolar-type H+-ATPase subunit I/STV1
MFSKLRLLAAPYLVYILAGLAAIVIWQAYSIGKKVERASNIKHVAELTAELQKRSESLRSAESAIRDIRAEAARVTEEARVAKLAASKAGEIAAAYRAQLSREQAAFAARLKAARKVASCAALLDINVTKVCGL